MPANDPENDDLAGERRLPPGSAVLVCLLLGLLAAAGLSLWWILA